MNLKIKYSISFLIVKILCIAMKFLPLKWNVSISKFILKCAYPLMKIRRNIAKDNLKKCFPEYSDSEINSIAFKSFENLAITFTELLYFPNLKLNKIRKLVLFENPDLLIDLYKKNNGLLLVSAHYGNWELMSLASKDQLGFNVLIPVKLLKNWYIDKLINTIRISTGNRIVNMDKSASEMVKRIKNKEAIGLLADQSAHEDTDVFVNFFDRHTLTFKAPAELALRYKVPFVFNFAERQSNGSYLVKSEIIPCDDLKYNKEDVKILIQRYSDALEKQLKINPSQWMWSHKRWKHSPKNEKI